MSDVADTRINAVDEIDMLTCRLSGLSEVFISLSQGEMPIDGNMNVFFRHAVDDINAALVSISKTLLAPKREAQP